jgi:hypothetical protein
MGTNIYARPIKKIEEIETQAQNVRNEIRAYTRCSSIELDDMINEWEQMKKADLKPIHIGKRSAGWRFLFNHNDWKYYNTIEEMVKFLKECELVTEYGTVESFEDFWKDVAYRQGTCVPASTKSVGQSDLWYVIKDGYEFSTSTEFC